MNNTELRIGNSLMFSENGETCIVTEITEGGLEVLFKNGEQVWIELDQFSPIELTPEILEKAGFRYDGYVWDTEKVMLGDYKDGIHFCNGFSIINKGIKLEYVHQLQNLYFALTHQELNINL